MIINQFMAVILYSESLGLQSDAFSLDIFEHFDEKSYFNTPKL